LALFEHLRQEMPDTEVVIITSHGDISQAVTAMKNGAHDYVSKPFQVEELLVRLSRLGAEQGVRRELEQARATLANLDPSTVLVGQSPPMRRLLGLVDTVSKTAAATLVTGESGTGKELVARMLHDLGPRREGPFVALNCGALAENLIEAELFGHERGAFTGAERKREGRFKAADGGTLFLDEIAELPAHAQAKLLRVLQEGSFEPIGSDTTVKVDVRVVSATHRDLRDRIREGLFREDLFYRINVIQIAVPPLRDRPGDLTLLVQYFLRRFAPPGRTPAISPEAWAAFAGHSWPGNVRELSHAIQHAVVLSGGGEITAEHLPNALSPPLPEGRPGLIPVVEVVGATSIHPLGQAVRAFEREYLTRVLAEARASKAQKVQIAEALGISRKTLWEKLRTYGIDTPSGPDDA
jgi:DNA-binding NtrC family response regulator